MTLRLPRLESLVPIVDSGGRPSQQFQMFWQKVAEAIQAHEAEQEATINRIRRINSHTDPTTNLVATDDGATASIEVLDHVRVYADGTTVSVTGDTQGGLTSDIAYGVYYDDEGLSETAPTYVFTTVIRDAYAAAADGRHFCGVIHTPPAGSAQTREGGGAYPAGSAIGGEI